mgnify:CR=1 FL=1
MLSMHTSPLAQPGEGDSGGMNVYVRELAASLAQAGVPVTVYVRRSSVDQPDRVAVEPLFEVRHVDAGPLADGGVLAQDRPGVGARKFDLARAAAARQEQRLRDFATRLGKSIPDLPVPVEYHQIQYFDKISSSFTRTSARLSPASITRKRCGSARARSR